jgi:hypothetical protein
MTVDAMTNADKVFFDDVTMEEVEDAAKHEQQGSFLGLPKELSLLTERSNLSLESVFAAGEADSPEQFRSGPIRQL